jgi:putative DNA primase/helicase
MQAAKDQAWHVFQNLANFSDAIDDDELPAVHYFRFDDAAQQRFDEWRAALELELRNDELMPAMASHLGKYRKLCPTMALLSALVDGERETVRDHHAAQGIAWCRYLRTHAERIYHAASRSEVDTAKLILNRIQKGELPSQFKARDIYRRGWSGLKDVGVVQAALEMLEVHDHLIASEQAGIGRPTTIYRVNPKILEGDQ